MDNSTKTIIRFAPKAWDAPVLIQGKGWTQSGRMLLFEFWNQANRLSINLVLGPGPEDTRQKLFEMAHANRPFRPAFRALGKSHNTIFQKAILTEKACEEASSEDLEEEIRKKWSQFLQHDLPAIQAVLDKQEWIWKAKNAED